MNDTGAFIILKIIPLGYSGKDMYRKVTEFKKHGIKVTE